MYGSALNEYADASNHDPAVHSTYYNLRQNDEHITTADISVSAPDAGLFNAI